MPEPQGHVYSINNDNCKGEDLLVAGDRSGLNVYVSEFRPRRVNDKTDVSTNSNHKLERVGHDVHTAQLGQGKLMKGFCNSDGSNNVNACQAYSAFPQNSVTEQLFHFVDKA